MSKRQLPNAFYRPYYRRLRWPRGSLLYGRIPGYNQIQIHPVDPYKTTFITPWGTFAYRVMPFSLKNADATFQWVMTYIFHNLAEIILAYC
jgi:hypothetical protein